jgi:hypothetical protein
LDKKVIREHFGRAEWSGVPIGLVSTFSEKGRNQETRNLICCDMSGFLGGDGGGEDDAFHWKMVV